MNLNEYTSFIYKTYQQAGLIFIPLAILSIISLSICIEKIFCFLFYLFKAPNKGNDKIPADLFDTTKYNNYHKSFITQSLNNSQLYLQHTLIEIENLNKGLWFIQLTIQLAPILGVLGTIIGVMQSIEGLDLSQANNISLVSKGFSKALITSIYGLSLASLSQFFYSLINSHIDKIQGSFRIIYQKILTQESNAK
ncbi:MAG: hypothetical protein COB02_02315 [Candidatus Cloacimonadota bacterium]|nr:MAG: hypothetical protein COB02_02315 [Candidatus Cloacimonadota bacterium]